MRTHLPRWLLCVLLALLLGAPGCGGPDGPEIWIYTSLYPHVIEDMTPALERAFPDVTFRWYQKGSEQVAVRLGVELEAGRTECDLLLTSDPFYYAQLKDAGRLLLYPSEATAAVPAELKDPDGAFCTVRIPVMVLGVRRDATQKPTGFGDLAKPAFSGLITSGDPLKSGTNFSTFAIRSRGDGWSWIEALRKNDLLAAGGNGSVLRRLESGERSVGVILLENLLARKDPENNPVEIVYPADGAIPIPSPIAILKSTDQPALAKRVHDFFFSEEMQNAIVRGRMYAAIPTLPAPAGARPWGELKLHPWSNALLQDIKARRDEIKSRWRSVMR